MRTLLEIYFGLNIFISGYILGDKWNWSKSPKEAIKYVLIALCQCVGITPYGMMVFIWMLLGMLYKKIDEKEFLLFYFQFYFTKSYSNLSKRTLSFINELNLKRNTENKNDKFWRKNVDKINKRNNYVHVPNVIIEEED